MLESLQFVLAKICRRLCDSCDTTIYGLENGLYKFTARFTNTPTETVWLDVGELTVAVTNAGDYVFLLKKGVDYEFGTRPYFDGVEYQMQDDLIAYRPLMSAWWDDWNTYGVWTTGGGERSLDYPEVGRPGYCVWLPTLRGSPDVTHLGPSGFPSEFTAVLSDYCGPEVPTFHWSASDQDFEFSSPDAQSTMVSCASLPSWGTYSLSVSANIGWYTLWSNLHSTRGTNELPQVGLTIDCQSVLLLNDDNRAERYYAVSIELNSDVATNGHITVVHEGDVEAAFFSDRGTNRVGLVDMDFTMESSYRYGFYISCSKCGTGSLSVLCTFSDGGQVERTHFYRVIEPICHWVSNEMDEMGRMHVNPSRLVRGERSTFRVGVNQGSFLPSEVQWLTQGVTTVSTSEWDLVVIPTSDAAAAAICPSFNDDVEQPIMAMPIVEKRRIPIRGYVVTPPEGVEVDDNWIDVMVDWANIVYRQAPRPKVNARSESKRG